jgi:hypothetical protein
VTHDRQKKIISVLLKVGARLCEAFTGVHAEWLARAMGPPIGHLYARYRCRSHSVRQMAAGTSATACADGPTYHGMPAPAFPPPGRPSMISVGRRSASEIT